jgi:hypothetical protein
MRDLGVGLDREQAGCEDRLRLAREDQSAGVLRPIQRLDPQPIAGHEQRLLGAVPDGEREHAVEPVQAPETPGLVGGEKNLGVGARPESLPLPLELRPEVSEVVNLAVVRDPEAPAGSRHGLRPGWRKVQDGETAVPEAERLARRAMQPLSIRATVGEQPGHPADDLRVDGADHACNPAHAVTQLRQ